jgi:hypothetical protein
MALAHYWKQCPDRNVCITAFLCVHETRATTYKVIASSSQFLFLKKEKDLECSNIKN